VQVTQQNAIGIVPGGPDAAEVLVPGFQGIEGEEGDVGAIGAATGVFVVADESELPGVPVVGNIYIVLDSTGVEDIVGLIDLPGGFVGSAALWVQLIWDATGPSWGFVNYGAIDPDDRYAANTSPVHVGGTEPADPTLQPFWYDTGEELLKLYDGADFVEASPQATPPAAPILPSGMVMHRASETPPAGWLVCDGSAVSRATYSDLFTAIGTTFGAGDGTTTFNLPDGRGQFIRGFADGVGADAARVFGTTQADEARSHTHATISGSASLALGSYTTNLVVANTVGGTETRPSNIALTMMIKT